MGIKASIPPINKSAQVFVRADYEKTFRVRAAQLFNLSLLKLLTKLDSFKVGHGRFFEQSPDGRPITCSGLNYG